MTALGIASLSTAVDRLRAALTLGALIASLGCVAVPTAGRSSGTSVDGGGDASISATAQLIVEETNRVRAGERLRPLSVQSQLVTAAQIQAEQMARYGVMAHEIPRAPYPTLKARLAISGYDYADAAENVARNFGTGTSVVTGWMRSPTHRVNILDPEFTEIGTGFALDGGGNKYYVQVFGRPRR